MKVLALNNNGVMTYCTCPPDMRGIGRCNHIEHQNPGENVQDFIKRVNSRIITDDEIVPDQKEFINKILDENKLSFNKNPDWKSRIMKEAGKYFHIGDKDHYEEATVKDVEEIKKLNENGDPVVDLKIHFEFRGKEYIHDLGEIPEVQEDGSIIMNGTAFRVLPVMRAHKSGIVRYPNGDTTFIDEDTRFVFSINKDNPDYCYVISNSKGFKTRVKTEEVQKFLNGDENADLPIVAKTRLKMLDPVAFEREPNLANDLKNIARNHKPDEVNDIEYRKCMTYEDQIAYQMNSTFYNMGTHFRTNLKYNEDHPGQERDLFQNTTFSKNVYNDLTGRANVQPVETLNPIAALSQAHKICITGPGGWKKDNAQEGLRQVHQSHKDKIDSLDISLGKNVGLTMTLQNADIDERGFIVKSDKRVLAPSDFMPYKNHNDINRASMFSAHIRQACPIKGGEDPIPVGDSSDDAWKSISGAKIGTNLNIAYIPMAKTHEDAIVLSESAAKKMATVQSQRYDLKDGVRIRNGANVKRGQKIGGVEILYDGKIKSVSKNSFEVETEFPMTIGDKIAGRHGNKGVCAEIRPDKDMPQIRVEDSKGYHYEPAQIVMSPMAVPGRINIGQIYETNHGDLNKVSNIKLANGNTVKGTAGKQYIMRLNHLAEKKLHSHDYKLDANREPDSARIGEMERIVMSSTENRRKILQFMHNQEARGSHQRLESLLHAVGVDLKLGVNDEEDN